MAGIVESVTRIVNEMGAMNLLINASHTAEAAARAAAAEAASGSTPQLVVSGALQPTCGSTQTTACTAAYHADEAKGTEVATMLVRLSQGGFFGIPGVYECAFTTKAVTITTQVLLISSVPRISRMLLIPSIPGIR